MAGAPVDVVVVGAGPAGSTAALVLARGGARVTLIDKATFARDKACGDLVGPRALALLGSLGLACPFGRKVGEMLVIGPNGREVVLPARGGRTYPDHAIAVTRIRFDAWLRDQAVAAGAEPVTGRATLLTDGSVELDNGRRLTASIVIGADGATSGVAAVAGLVDQAAVLWGFAQRGYVRQDVQRPIIALWDESPGRGFPGYGWLFPGDDGMANVGLGLGMRSDRSQASRAVARLDEFCEHLCRLGYLSARVEGRRLGGWLKMGIVGTIAAHGNVLLVGDAAGLVNPLQGEGIAPAITSGAAAANAVLAGPESAAARYLQYLADGPGRYAAIAAPLHAAAITGSPRRVAILGRALTMPGLGATIAAPWALLWNDLVDGAPPGPTAMVSHAVAGVGRLATSRSAIRRRLGRDLAG